MERVTDLGRLTPDEYLVWEEQQEERHEYHDGEVFSMSGGSDRHALLATNVIVEVSRVLGDSCVAFTCDRRLKIDSGNRFVYPDVTVVCGVSRRELANATMIIEVLSRSTEGHDRGLKWEIYQRIAGLTDYLLVAQRAVRIEQFRRETDRAWLYRAYCAGERVVLAGGAELEVDAIYRRAFEFAGDS